MSTIKTTTLSTQGGSTVPVDTVVNGTAKAWVNFNGTGTVAVRRAFNVSSITDNSVGGYTVNFSTAMVDADYAATFMTGSSSLGGINALFTASASTSSIITYVYAVAGGGAGAFRDAADISVSIFS
jgi:hypothetical protein